MAEELMSIPNDLRHLRACLLCSLIKVNSIICHFILVNCLCTCNCCYHQSFEQFEFDGCDNCEEFLGMKNNREMVYDCTSNNFDGYCALCYCFVDVLLLMILMNFRMIALTNPDESWVAKWQKISNNILRIVLFSAFY